MKMDSIREAESATELEALCKQDSSWYPCQVSLSSTEDSLIVDFGRQELEDMVLNKDEALTRLRFRSAPLQGDDCSRIEGEHVLSIHKSPFKSHLYDAKVEKVTRVRHSTRVYCRCSFMITWLHPDFKGQMVTVPSSSIMKLASKSISSHPTVAALLKSVKQMGLYTAPPLPIMHEDNDFEFDLNKLLGKQIEEINISANGVTNETTIDILEGVKAVDNGHVTVSKVGTSKAQVSHDQDQLKSVTNRPGNLEVNIEDEDPKAPLSSKQEEHSEHRSHISPLAARAALASLVSLTHKHIAISGTELFKSSDSNNMSIMVSSTTIKSPKNENVNSGVRTTRSTVQKGFGIQNSDLHDSTEAIELRVLTNTGRLTRLAVKEEKDISSMEIKQGSEESESAQITGSYSSEGTDIVHESKVLRKKNDISDKAVSSPLHSESNGPKENLTAGDLEAIQDAYVQMKTCAKDTKSSVSTNMRRLTRSMVSCKDNLIVPESHAVEKENRESKKKKAVSATSHNDSTQGEESNRKHKSGGVRNSRQTEGKMSGSGDNSQGQKRKSTSLSRQEQRFSPRLRFLPHTRSQNKS
ncbi:uncharacterized protein LOC133721551 isoform X1 [Rosa rugosa]|uniref:uncharacterized protein LOC133721551 isoform X1 n=2 Tax=Rosa rugosa TaxID=74645 RepID=UPI002B40EF51|nr:uncharacterized protein LOC133721551 isoform X1 [Rosa rugosa]